MSRRDPSRRRGADSLEALVGACLEGRLRERLGRLAAVALVGALGAFAFADGLHSVHHLPDHKAASRCAVVAASAGVVGGTLDVIPVALPPPPRLADRDESEPAAPWLPPVWTEQGRAPPTSPS